MPTCVVFANNFQEFPVKDAGRIALPAPLGDKFRPMSHEPVRNGSLLGLGWLIAAMRPSQGNWNGQDGTSS